MIDTIITALIFIAALAYAVVGHGGASGYTAVLALMGVEGTDIRSSILMLNILVSGIGMVRFMRAGIFNWSLFWPFAIVSIPMAFIGGRVELPSYLLEPIMGVVLIISSLLTALRTFYVSHEITPPQAPNRPILMGTGACLGFLAGLTGIGGGVFLSPLMVLLRWAEVRTVSAIAATFIFVNSVAGLLGRISQGITLMPSMPYWLVAAGVGGLIGSWLGAKKLGSKPLTLWLALIVFTAGLKLVFTGH